MDIIDRIRKELGSAPLKHIESIADSADVRRWTLIKVARGYRDSPRREFLQKMTAYYARKRQPKQQTGEAA